MLVKDDAGKKKLLPLLMVFSEKERLGTFGAPRLFVNPHLKNGGGRAEVDCGAVDEDGSGKLCTAGEDCGWLFAKMHANMAVFNVQNTGLHLGGGHFAV